MPIPATPGIIPMPFAQNGQKNTIPEQAGTTTDPAASWIAGFPPITMVNKQAGGKPPYGVDFNGILFALSQHAFFTQSGCVYPWMGADEDSDFPGLNYLKGAHVLGSDGEEYVALKPSGPDVPASAGGFVGPVDPVGDESGTWAKAASVYAPLATANTPGIVKPDGTTITVNDQGTISAVSVPVGAVLAFSGPGTPEGYLLCNGAAVSRTTYAALFAVIGAWNGDGDGSTTFNLPNLSDNRFPQGSTTPGTYKSAGVPEIVGAVAFNTNGYLSQNTSSGALYSSNSTNTTGNGVAGTGDTVLNFRASYSNNLYGDSETIQPEALTVRYCIKY